MIQLLIENLVSMTIAFIDIQVFLDLLWFHVPITAEIYKLYYSLLV